MENLPYDMIDSIQGFIPNIHSKQAFKLTCKHFNCSVEIPCNFTNKFLSWCENTKFDKSHINFCILKQFDKLVETESCKHVDIMHNTFPTGICKVTISPRDMKFQSMLPFSHLYDSSFKIYNRFNDKKWMWYHSITKYKTNMDNNWINAF